MPTREHTEIDASRDHDLWQTCLADPLQSARSSVVDASDHRIGDLVGGEVDDADELPRLRQLLHGEPADTIGVEYDGLVAVLGQAIAQSHHRLGGVAEHRHADETTFRTTWLESARIGGHGGHRRGHVVEHRGRHRVQTHDVDHGVHHHHVRSAHQGPELVTTEAIGLNSTFGTPIGSTIRAAAPSPRPPPRPARLRHRPSRDRAAPSSTTGRRCASWPPPAPGAGLADLIDRGPGVRRHLAMVYVGNDAERLAQDPDVYHRRGTTLLDETITDVRHLGALGVQGADDDDVWRHLSLGSVAARGRWPVRPSSRRTPH